jgi:diguanylate cyclase (GGDEF)-like protein
VLADEGAPAARPSRVLLVGEDPRLATTIVEMLRAVWPQGLLTTQAPTIPDAIQELSDHVDSCVLLTLRDDGDPLAPLHELTAAAPSAPIVVLSGGEDDSIGVAAVQAGAQDHLSVSELHPALLARCVRYAVERKRAEVRLTRRALQDPLTGLPNRLLFRDRVSMALDRSQRTGLAPAVMFLDLDAFKEINDTLGHTAGDRVLHELSARFTALLRPMDTVARIGGDEFTFLFEGLSGEDEAMAIAQRIAEAAAEPIDLPDAGSGVSIAVSIGITMLRDPGISLDDALREADGAMYRAKRLGGGRAELSGAPGEDPTWSVLRTGGSLEHEPVFTREREQGHGEIDPPRHGVTAVMLAEVEAETEAESAAEAEADVEEAAQKRRLTRPRTARLTVADDPFAEDLARLAASAPAHDEAAAELHDALGEGQLRVHYQPRVTISGQTGLVGFEALVRWRHPRRGLLEPREFLPAADEAGLIGEIGDWVLEQALVRSRRWREARPEVSISVNVAASQLADPRFPGRVEWAIERAGGDPSVLWLEIAADTLAGGRFDREVLGELVDLGVSLALDGFSLGGAAPEDLRALPLDMLKIDRSVVAPLGSDHEQGAVVDAVVELGHALGLSVVAEGVETDHQLARLRELGCDGAQGFLFSQPVPDESVGELLGLG